MAENPALRAFDQVWNANPLREFRINRVRRIGKPVAKIVSILAQASSDGNFQLTQPALQPIALRICLLLGLRRRWRSRWRWLSHFHDTQAFLLFANPGFP